MNFAVSADHRVKMKENEKTEKDMNFSRNAEKDVEKLEVRGRIETIQNAVLLRSTRITKRPRDQRRIAVTQTLVKVKVKDHELTLA